MVLWEMPASQPEVLGQFDAAQNQGRAQLGTRSPCIADTATATTANPLNSAPALLRQGGPESTSTTWGLREPLMDPGPELPFVPRHEGTWPRLWLQEQH